MRKDIDMKIKRKKPFDPEWYLKERRQDWVLPRILRDRAAKFGDKLFLQYQDEKPYTFKEVNTLSNKIANGLIKIGVTKGDRVSVFLPNSADYVLIWFGILKAGGVLVPVNNAYKMDFLQFIIDNSDSKVSFVSDHYLERLALIQDRIPRVEKVIVLPHNKEKAIKYKGTIKQQLISHKDFLDDAPSEEPDIDIRFIDVARLQYTSGRTVWARGATKSHAGDYYSARGCVELLDVDETDTLLTTFPLYYSNALVLCVYPALIAGAKVAIYERFSTSHFWKWVKESGATVFNLLGAMNYFLWKQRPTIEEKEHRVRLALMSPAPHDILEQFMERFNLSVLEFFGMPETGVIAYTRPDEPFRIGSRGREAPGYEVKIVDHETDEELPRGDVGEIVVRPRIPNIMLYGYHKIYEEAVRDFRNLWFHTGDSGKMDEDGYLYFVDRIRPYIRRRGEDISSFEIERIIAQHHAVAEVAVIGIDSEEGRFAEEEILAVIVNQPNTRLSCEALIKHCEERMPYFMLPRFIKFADELPKTANHVVQKQILKQQGITPDIWDLSKSLYKIKR